MNFKMVLGLQIIVYLLAVGSSLCVIFQFLYSAYLCTSHDRTSKVGYFWDVLLI